MCGPLTSIYLLFLMSFKYPIIGSECIILTISFLFRSLLSYLFLHSKHTVRLPIESGTQHQERLLSSNQRHLHSNNKRHGERGSPFLRPFLPSKCPTSVPFKATRNLGVLIHSLTLLMYLQGNLNHSGQHKRNSQSTES
jgi:hypothetical protein